MGNSAPSRHIGQEQQDLKALGERFPFGDKELVHLYTAYHALLDDDRCRQQEPSEDHHTAGESPCPSSFLIEWSVQCSDSNPTSRQERETLFQVIESQILPQEWGQQLYQTAFCASPADDPFGYSCSDNKTAPTDEYTRKRRLEAFFEGVSNASRRGAKHSLTVLFQSVAWSSDNAKHRQYCKARDLCMLAYKLAIATAFLKASATDESLDMADYIPTEQDDLSQIDALAQSMLQRAHDRRNNHQFAAAQAPSQESDITIPDDCMTLDELLEWCDATAPLFASILPTFLYQVFFPHQPFPPSRTAFCFPQCLQESAFFESPRSPRLFCFGCLSSALNGSFFRLYASSQDGLSFNRLQNALVGYNGPTLILIRSTASATSIFGAFTASQWKESKDFYGLSDCFLYQLSPRTTVYRPTGSNQHYMYCNPQARSKGYDKQAHGLGFGGTVDLPRLFLAENFDDNVAASVDLTFDNGPLLPQDGVGSSKTQFSIDSLEVWGVGGDDVVQQALGARDKARAMKDEGIRRARKVDKAQFLDDFRSGAIASKAFAYKDQIDGRADDDVKERHQIQSEKLG